MQHGALIGQRVPHPKVEPDRVLWRVVIASNLNVPLVLGNRRATYFTHVACEIIKTTQKFDMAVIKFDTSHIAKQRLVQTISRFSPHSKSQSNKSSPGAGGVIADFVEEDDSLAIQIKLCMSFINSDSE
jgi:hypothetical protein